MPDGFTIYAAFEAAADEAGILKTANVMRAHMAEFGIIAATGMTSIAKLVAAVSDHDGPLPRSARAALLEMAEQIERLTKKFESLDTKIVAAVRADEAARHLTTIPGVGPIIAATVRAAVQDPTAFRTGRDLAAWIGITPRANPPEEKSDSARSRSRATSSCGLS